MSFEELVKMVEGYAVRCNCTIAESNQDVEFDGPSGGFGLDESDLRRLEAHFDVVVYEIPDPLEY